MTGHRTPPRIRCAQCGADLSHGFYVDAAAGPFCDQQCLEAYHHTTVQDSQRLYRLEGGQR